MNIHEITTHLDELLRTRDVRDYSPAHNGLQVENRGEITRVAAAVDACEAVLKMAVDSGASLLVVHHGLFWTNPVPVTGPVFRKLKLCLDANLAVYSSHLPLDLHPEFGNNTLLCDALGLPKEREPFLESQGQPIGLQVRAEIPREELSQRLATALGSPIHLAPGGPEVTRRIGVVTGGAGAEIFKAAAAGVDTFVTGEGPHWSYTAAEEAGINLFYGGHYATETFGVKALAAHLESKFGLPWQFLDHPSGL